MSNYNRRQFIRYTSGGIAGAALVAGGWWYWGRSPGQVIAPSGLGAGADRVLAELNGAGAVGQWVIEAYPDYDRPADELAQLLRARLQLPASGPVAQQQFNELIQHNIQQDFTRGDLVSVQNWQLSTTEALVAALRFKTAGNSTIAVTQDAQEQLIAEVTNWGPRTTTAGVLPNSFGEGFTALWFDAADAPRWAKIAINHQRLHTSYRENRVLVASFRGQREFQERLFGQPGEYPITLHDDMTNRWQTVGVFVVTEALADTQAGDADDVDSAFCKVINWGPKNTTAGVVKNQQSTGNMGIWIDIDCAPADTRLQAGDRLFNVHIREGVITAGIPPEMLQQPGEIPLSLVSESAAEQLTFGQLMIEPD